jgi:hypothetical protein
VNPVDPDPNTAGNLMCFQETVAEKIVEVVAEATEVASNGTTAKVPVS